MIYIVHSLYINIFFWSNTIARVAKGIIDIIDSNYSLWHPLLSCFPMLKKKKYREKKNSILKTLYARCQLPIFPLFLVCSDIHSRITTFASQSEYKNKNILHIFV